jgi:cytidylate kinase
MIITIDGPAGTGKSTVAQLVAARLGYTYLDTGAMFRLVTLAALRRHVAYDADELLAQVAAGLDYQASDPDIRSAAVSAHVSEVSALPKVRAVLLDKQRELGAGIDLVCEGRDMGTVVFPDAALKVFLTASAAVRARRRHDQLVEQTGSAPQLAEIEAAIVERDRKDSQRKVAPLKPAPDAHLIDTSALSIDEVVAQILTLATC